MKKFREKNEVQLEEPAQPSVWRELQPGARGGQAQWSSKDARLYRGAKGSPRLTLGGPACERMALVDGGRIQLSARGRVLGIATPKDGGLFTVRRSSRKPHDQTLFVANIVLRTVLDRPGVITYRLRAGKAGEPAWVLDPLTTELR